MVYASIISFIGIPLLLAALASVCKRAGTVRFVTPAGYALLVVASGRLLYQLGTTGAVVSWCRGFFSVDCISAFFLFVTSIVSFAVSLYSAAYFASPESSEHPVSENKLKMYYVLLNLFCCSMYLVPMLNNLGMLWVAIEMTTLISAFLVGFYNTKYAVEAAWKYVVVCSVGIVLALLGTILCAYALPATVGVRSLNWTDMVAAAGRFDPVVLKVAFLFILVGYGTKAGLAPMHTWLPDAHSQAVGPVSALLSGVLLKTALYALIRFVIILTKNGLIGYCSNLLLLFGVVSLAVAAGLVLVQKDMKRLLAYSSIEHVGIVTVGLGIGGPIGIFGALFHVLNHALAKSVMFLGASSVIKQYNCHSISGIRGVLSSMRFVGVMLLLGVCALAGFPPFAIFWSELFILKAIFMKGNYGLAIFFLTALSIIFSALISVFGKMLFGRPPKDMGATPAPKSWILAFLLLMVPLVAMGIHVPAFLQQALNEAVRIMGPGLPGQ